MASASSSSSPSSCLSPQSKYDVFLSFRGEDTRNNFTSHLFAALHRKKIQTFDDEGLKRGREISPVLLNAIERSKISIIIFSKNYASSRWCLDELVKILECQKMNEQMVLPVFYHVNPSYVRKQIGSFGDAFVEHEENFKDMPEKVKEWRAALTEASNLSGWDSMVTRPEARLVEAIVADVLKKLKDITVSSGFEGFVGLNSRLEQIKSLLCIELSDFRVIGIWGMGGIGKTTIAGALFNLISSEFEGKSFMANVREELENGVGLLHLREKILSQVLEENLNIGTPEIPEYIKGRLQRMKVFICLDDVNKFGQLEYLAGGLERFGPGSRIIVTTRNKRILEKYGVENIYEVEGFNHHEALELFCNYAFRKNHPSQDLMHLSSIVVNYAKGNPLALKVLGSSLHQRSKQDWEDALRDLKQISGPDIHDVLKISYDELNWEEKNLFLDIACFFRGEDKDYVTMILEDQYSVNYGLSVLVDKSLLTISRNMLQMHNLLQEMGQKIIWQESEKEPGKRSRLWYHEDIYHVLRKNKGTDSIEGLFLDMSKIRDLHLSSGAFTNMPNLRLLKFYMPRGFDSNISCKVHIPQGLEHLSDELRYLYWHGYPLQMLPSDFSAENLVVVSLPCSKVKQLWEGEKEAFKLKQIDLCHCQNLTRIPDPWETPSLEGIYLSNCTNLPYIPSSIQDFSNLSTLCLQGCKSLKSFPSNIHFRSPITLDFSYCVNITDFPRVSGNIKRLYLCGTAIEEVPSWIECLTELSELYMRQCTRLRSLSTSVCKLKSLHMLNLDDCWRLESFPEILVTMECLEYISLTLTPIKMLPSSIENGMLPSSFADLEKLTENWCYGSRGLLLPPLPGLSSLTRLYLSYHNITEIPQHISYLSSVRTLDLRGNNFENLPASIKQLSRLEELILSNCNVLQSLPELPPSLLWLEARNCKRLQSLPELPSCLEELDVSKLEKLSELSYGFARPKITFTFTNCLKLNKNQDENILADSQLRIQHMGTASLGLFYEKVFDVPPQFSISLPGSGIPDWFSYQSSGSSITIQLPQHWCNRTFLGFALCVVIAFEEDFDAGYCFGVRCGYHLEANKSSEARSGNWVCFLTSTTDHRVEDLLICSDHVLLGFDPCLDFRLADGGPHTVASFHFTFLCNGCSYVEDSCQVKCCGVSPLYANPYETQFNVFTEKLATTSEEEYSKRRKLHIKSIYHDQVGTSGSTGIIGRSGEKEVEPNSKRTRRGKINAL
ncbi:Disease resistance protein (TIR-NBS-LRR class) family [Melia azedarach]|uniref:Disease resistance protein (TIR-NBS-LRR class) family n=1 Tax=Melia azedarach TaxID=155640 RepID=A0ACC1YIZ7_MELAZ|nr:Disease resistance protein (TIR-NBS-LRR class) family [Melia azedarach]